MIVTKACQECNGHGYTTVFTDHSASCRTCKRCNGTGSVNVCATHKEILQNATVDELSVLFGYVIRLCPVASERCNRFASNISCGTCWKNWLEKEGLPDDTLLSAFAGARSM